MANRVIPADALLRQRSGNDDLERGVTGEDVEVDVGVQDGGTGLDGGGGEAVDEPAYGRPLSTTVRYSEAAVS